MNLIILIDFRCNINNKDTTVFNLLLFIGVVFIVFSLIIGFGLKYIAPKKLVCMLKISNDDNYEIYTKINFHILKVFGWLYQWWLAFF